MPKNTPCKACNATGKMTYVNQRLDPLEREPKTKTCPHCKGAGWLETKK